LHDVDDDDDDDDDDTTTTTTTTNNNNNIEQVLTIAINVVTFAYYFV
jgi:hypothetical protein